MQHTAFLAPRMHVQAAVSFREPKAAILAKPDKAKGLPERHAASVTKLAGFLAVHVITKDNVVIRQHETAFRSIAARGAFVRYDFIRHHVLAGVVFAVTGLDWHGRPPSRGHGRLNVAQGKAAKIVRGALRLACGGKERAAIGLQ
jgi:hypothetical protein